MLFAFILLYFFDLLSLQCQHPLPGQKANWTERKENSLPGTFVSGSESSREPSFPGVKVAGNFRSWEWRFPLGTFALRSENTGNEKSWYPPMTYITSIAQYDEIPHLPRNCCRKSSMLPQTDPEINLYAACHTVHDESILKKSRRSLQIHPEQL